MNIYIKILIFSIVWSLGTTVALSQDCDPVELSKIPGSWSGGKRGSIENVSAADLAKEREVLSKIHGMMNRNYTPVGGVISYSNVFGYNKYSGKNWIADPYSYSMYFLEYVCEKRTNSDKNYAPNAETSATVYFHINEIWSHLGNFELHAAELPEDHYDGYLIIKFWPEKKGNQFFWELEKPTDRYPVGEKQYLITYEDKLPFMHFSKEEYLALKIPELKKAYEESLEILNSNDTTLDDYSRRRYEEYLPYVQEKKDQLEEAETLLQKLSPDDLVQPAIIYAGESRGEFLGFKSPDEENVIHLVKPNLAYFDPKLPKWVPQFISVTIQYDIKEQINYENIQMIEKAIDFGFLKSLLGKTQIP